MAKNKIDQLGFKNGLENEDKDSFALWIISAITPVFILLFAFVFYPWNWGLMDDWTILDAGQNIAERLAHYQFGAVFRPVYSVHASVFYSLFENNPQLFHIFRLVEVLLVLVVWALLLFRMTRRWVAIALFLTVSFSFHYLYDAFFYLSSQEIIGLFFLGLAIHFLVCNQISKNSDPSQEILMDFRWSHLIIGLILMVFAVGSKEPFLAGGGAIGLFYLTLVFFTKNAANRKAMLISGVAILLMCLLYGIYLLVFVRSGYSATYGSNASNLFANAVVWIKKDLSNHIPWVVLSLWICYLGKRQNGGVKLNATFFYIVFGVLLYVCYFFILLPWNTSSYYAGPLGVFFAWIVTLLITEVVLKITFRSQCKIVLCALVFNIFVCRYALGREFIYKYDTDNLMQWMKIHHENFQDKNLFTNAMEPGEAIPALTNRKFHLNIQKFAWSPEPAKVINDLACDYYLFSSRFGSLNESHFPAWKPVFLSKNWILYRLKE